MRSLTLFLLLTCAALVPAMAGPAVFESGAGDLVHVRGAAQPGASKTSATLCLRDRTGKGEKGLVLRPGGRPTLSVAPGGTVCLPVAATRQQVDLWRKAGGQFRAVMRIRLDLRRSAGKRVTITWLSP